jgi:hypothetical protein
MTTVMIPPEVALERFLNDKQVRKEKKYEHILGRLTIEELPSNHIYRWLADWMNVQLADMGVNSTGGLTLPPFHFDFVRVNKPLAAAHAFETEEFGFIVMTEPMADEMRRLSNSLVERHRAFMLLQIAPAINQTGLRCTKPLTS